MIGIECGKATTTFKTRWTEMGIGEYRSKLADYIEKSSQVNRELAEEGALYQSNRLLLTASEHQPAESLERRGDEIRRRLLPGCWA